MPDRCPSCDDLAGEVVELRAVVERLTARLDVVGAENAELRRRLGMDSTNSSVPPSKESIATKAKRRSDWSSRVRSAARKPGGQPGRKGSGLRPTPDPDRTERVAPPGQCRECRAELTGASVLPQGWAQVWDVAPAVLHKTHYLLPRRRCGCGVSTTAVPPFGQAGSVSYGPNLERRRGAAGQRGQRAGRTHGDADPRCARRRGLDRVRCPCRRTSRAGAAGRGV